MLNARWTAVVNDEIGGWSVTHNGKGPLNGGPMPADMVWSREIAERIAADHNEITAVRAKLAAVLAAIGREHYPLGDTATEGNVWCACDKLWPCPTIVAVNPLPTPPPDGVVGNRRDATSGPLCASTAAERGAVAPESTPSPTEAVTAGRRITEENQ